MSSGTVTGLDNTTIDAIIPLTLGDVERFGILQRSLSLFFRDLGTCWVVTPDKHADAVRSRIPQPPYQVISETSLIPELRFYDVVRIIAARTHRPTQGWSIQQLIKLAIAEHVRTDFYLTLDADVICTKPVSRSRLVRDGRAICRLRQADVIDQWPQWYEWAERILGLPRSGINRGVTPALFNTEAVRGLHAHLERRVHPRLRALAQCLPRRSLGRHLLASWRSYLLRNLPWTEYSLYDTFVEASGLFHKYHSEDERTTISGNSVWYQYMWPAWNPGESFTDRDDFFFSVVQSNQGFGVDQVWEKVRPYLPTERVSIGTEAHGRPSAGGHGGQAEGV